MSIGGNLLSDNMSDLETSAADWTTGAGTFARDTAQAYTGSASLKITSAGSGNTFCYSAVNLTGLTAGVTYTMYAWAWTATASLTFKTGCDWKTSAGAFVSSSASSGIVLATSTWTLVSLSAACPATADRALLYTPWFVATGAGQIGYFDAMFFGVPAPPPPPIRRPRMGALIQL